MGFFLLSAHTAFKEQRVLFLQSLTELQESKRPEVTRTVGPAVPSEGSNEQSKKQNISSSVHANCTVTSNTITAISFFRGEDVEFRRGSEHACPWNSNWLRHI